MSIGGDPIHSSLNAAAAMRDGHGLVSLVVVRPTKNKFAGAAAARAASRARSHSDRRIADPTLANREMVPTPSITPAAGPEGGKRAAHAGCADAFGAMLRDLAASLAQCLQGPEEAAAQTIQAQWRGKQQRLALQWQKWATSEVQRTLRGRSARRSTRGLRTEAQAALTLQTHTRGFIDRQWCMMVRHEIARRREAMAEEAAATPRGIARRLSFGRENKVKRAFSFSRKQQRKRAATEVDSIASYSAA